MSSVAELEEELRREYSKKTNGINELLREIDPDSSLEYNLIDLQVSSKYCILKCKVNDAKNNTARIIGLEAVDRRLRALTNQAKLEKLKGKENHSACITEKSAINSSSNRKNESNKILFDTIQLIDKLRSQYELLK